MKKIICILLVLSLCQPCFAKVNKTKLWLGIGLSIVAIALVYDGIQPRRIQNELVISCEGGSANVYPYERNDAEIALGNIIFTYALYNFFTIKF